MVAKADDDSGIASVAELSPREIEILRLLATGFSVREAAQKLSLHYKTVDHQKTALMNKLRIHNRVVLAHFAIKHGIVDVIGTEAIGTEAKEEDADQE